MNVRQPHGSESSAHVIGQPIHFVGGQFAGQVIRAELQELQKAELGRKYAKVDRRPIDPPPVVLLRLFQVFNVGTSSQADIEVEDYEDIRNLGIMCTVDLFPVPGLASTDSNLQNTRARQPSSQTPKRYAPSNASQYLPDSQKQAFIPLFPSTHRDTNGSVNIAPFHVPQQSPPDTLATDSSQDVILQIGSHLITEGSKITCALVGGTVVEPALVDYQGKKALIFVFSDLAVKREGNFLLRYRIFDIFSFGYGTIHYPIQAELYGGVFRVYSTRDFPGLQASTDLTKRLSRFGIRLTTRDAERRPQKKKTRKGYTSTLLQRRRSRSMPSDDRRDN